MTEAEWLAYSDPQKLLEFLPGKASDRKLRLFVVACCRRIWPLLTDERSRNAVGILERFSDQLATEEELILSANIAEKAAEELEDTYSWGTRGQAAIAKAALAAQGSTVGLNYSRLCQLAAEAAGHAAGTAAAQESEAWKKWVATRGTPEESPAFAKWVVEGDRALAAEEVAKKAENVNQTSIFRDIFGNPFRPATIETPWLVWNDRVVPQMAQAIYDERAFDRLPILADALEEAGCTDQSILNHCRSGIEHVRGCWVVDLCLGKS